MNALIDQLAALRLHGMAACAQDLLAARTPPSLTTALKTFDRSRNRRAQGAVHPVSDAHREIPPSQGLRHLQL